MSKDNDNRPPTQPPRSSADSGVSATPPQLRERYAIGDQVAGGRIDIVYDHDCPAGHVIRGAMTVILCPYCAVKRAEKAEADRDTYRKALERIERSVLAIRTAALTGKRS